MLKNIHDVLAAAERLSIEGRAFINGELCHAHDNKTFSCLSSVDGRLLQKVAHCGQEDVEKAVLSARTSFNSGMWSSISAKERKNVILKWSALLQDHFEELCLLEALDSGKPIRDLMEGDIPCSIECLSWYAEIIDKINDECLTPDPSYLGLISREPIGVVAAVIPWNFPLLMAMWKIAPALAAGNSVILKPSEKTPLTAIKIATLAFEAGIPAGVLNVLPGDGVTGSHLSQHMDVDCIAFTGSGTVGRKIMADAANSNLKRVWLELGGKTPHIILADCPDLKRAAQAVTRGIFSNMGQVCNAGSRLIIHRSLKDDFLKNVLEMAKAYTPANPLDPNTTAGAIIDEIQFKRIMNYIDAGHKENATLLLGGKQVRIDSGGYYIEPTVFETSPHMKIAREEIFGPVLSVIVFDTIEEAISLANDTSYGLAAGLWTGDMHQVFNLSKQLRAGTVWVNCFDEPFNMNFPFGGYKQSGNGRDMSIHALEKYTELKTTVIGIMPAV